MVGSRTDWKYDTRRSYHLVVEAAQRLICKDEEARSRFLVVPYSSPLVHYLPVSLNISGVPTFYIAIWGTSRHGKSACAR